MLAAVASLPLVWRRRQLVAVAALVGAGTIGLAVEGTLFQIPVPYGQLVATYTLASLAPPLWRLLGMAPTAAGVVVVAVLLLGRGPATLGTAGLPFVIAYALGVGTRARRDRIASRSYSDKDLGRRCPMSGGGSDQGPSARPGAGTEGPDDEVHDHDVRWDR